MVDWPVGGLIGCWHHLALHVILHSFPNGQQTCIWRGDITVGRKKKKKKRFRQGGFWPRGLSARLRGPAEAPGWPSWIPRELACAVGRSSTATKDWLAAWAACKPYHMGGAPPNFAIVAGANGCRAGSGTYISGAPLDDGEAGGPSALHHTVGSNQSGRSGHGGGGSHQCRWVCPRCGRDPRSSRVFGYFGF